MVSLLAPRGGLGKNATTILATGAGVRDEGPTPRLPRALQNLPPEFWLMINSPNPPPA